MNALEEMRGQLRDRRKPAPPPWVRPSLADFAGHVPVHAFDATLSHCGWVVAERGDGKIMVYAKGTINLETSLTSYLSTWDKARMLRDRYREVLADFPGLRRVVEAPAVAGHRLESSLIAGMLLWLETVDETGQGCTQISPAHISKVLCGNGRLRSAHRKQAIKAACGWYLPESQGRTWNEHQRDALAVALTDWHDLKVPR